LVTTAALQADTSRLADEISHLVGAWDAAAEVDTNLGNDVERAGQSLAHLLGRAAAAVTPSDPLCSAELHRAAVQLGEALDYYAGLEEHETDASIDIFDRLGPGIALVLRAVQGQEDPAVDEHATGG
jgi:hypothetical protein